MIAATGSRARHEAFGRRLFAEGRAEKVFLTHQQRAAECASHALAEAGIGKDDIRHVIIHNIGHGDAVAHLGMLGFRLDQTIWSYGSGIGPTGASDHLISLRHLLATGQLGAGDYVLLTGMAPGVTYKSAVVEILDVPPGARSWPD
jgi:3-oxoacyl-[acyl-carrier-protein] synthase-3